MIVTTVRHFNFCFPRDCYAETSKEGDRGFIIWWNIQELTNLWRIQLVSWFEFLMDNYQTIRRKQRFFYEQPCVCELAHMYLRTHVCDQGGCMRLKSGVIIYSPLVFLTYKTLPRICLQFVIVAFPDHTHLLSFVENLTLPTAGCMLARSNVESPL